MVKYMLNQTVDLDRTFQALADTSRRTMVERLTLGPASVSELAEPLAMSLAAVVQHVQVLEACGPRVVGLQTSEETSTDAVRLMVALAEVLL